MNVLVIGKFYVEAFALHIAETLVDMGHSVRRFEPGIRSGRFGGGLGHRIDQFRGLLNDATDPIPSIRRARIRTLWKEVARGPLDLVIVCHDFLWPEEVEQLKRKSGARVVMWFPDHLGNFGRAYFMNAPYDSLFFKDPYAVRTLRDVLTSPVHYLPECFNPGRHSLPSDSGPGDPVYRCDITTAGNMHSWRIAIFRHLADYDVKLWGKAPPLWMHVPSVARMYQGRAVYDHEKVRAFRGAKVVLNTLHYGEIWGVNVRTFEAAGAGAFQMVSWRPGLEQLFLDGRELVAFHDIADLKIKLEKYLGDDRARESIAAAGQRRAFAEHTYEMRLNLLLDTASGSEMGFPLPPVAATDGTSAT